MKSLNGIKFKSWTVNVSFGRYGNGRIAIKLDSPTDGPVAVASVNVSDADECADDEVYVKDYSENEGMAQWLIDNGIIEPAVLGSKRSGFVVISRYKLTEAAQAVAK